MYFENPDIWSRIKLFIGCILDEWMFTKYHVSKDVDPKASVQQET